jgi:hypothetical protein
MDTLLSVGHLAWILVVVVIVAAWPYAQLVKHERHPPLAGFLLFTSVLILSAAALFLAILVIATVLGLTTYLSGWLAAVLIMAAIFVPAILIARYVVRRPPRRISP